MTNQRVWIIVNMDSRAPEGACGVFSSKEKAVTRLKTMVEEDGEDFAGNDFLIYEMLIDEDIFWCGGDAIDCASNNNDCYNYQVLRKPTLVDYAGDPV